MLEAIDAIGLLCHRDSVIIVIMVLISKTYATENTHSILKTYTLTMM